MVWREVGKRKTSKYETGRRSDAWQKVINWMHADVYILGYKKAEFDRLAGVEDERGKVRPAGIINYGAGHEEKKAFYRDTSRSLPERIAISFTWSRG